MAFTNPNYKLEESKSASYLKFSDTGKHIFRFMGDIEAYNRYWKDGRPYRYDSDSELPKDIDLSDYTGKPRKEHAWNVVAIKKTGTEKEIGLLTITQKLIQKQLMSYYDDPEYGDFTEYDIEIENFGKNVKPQYQAKAKIPKPVTDEELEMYEKFEPKDLSQKDTVSDPARKPQVASESVSPSEIPF